MLTHPAGPGHRIIGARHARARVTHPTPALSSAAIALFDSVARGAQLGEHVDRTWEWFGAQHE